jgi:hypothetical protein
MMKKEKAANNGAKRIEGSINLKKYLISGVLFGFFFPVIALSIDMIHKEIVLSVRGILELHRINPIHYIIDCAPLVLGGLFYWLGKKLLIEKENVENIIETQLKIKIDSTKFAVELSKGNYDSDSSILNKNDELCQALMSLQTSLQENEIKDKKRKEDDDKRNWLREGLADFADVLRKDNDNLENLSYHVISSLVKYLDAELGGVFLIEDKEGEKSLKMTACFAYDRRKYFEKSLGWGEGLIGTAIIEKLPVYMTKLPEEYLEITSGLGDSPPGCLMISPLISNQEVFGAIEIASFNNFEDHHKELIESLSEDFASTISSVLINIKTASLLEDFKKQSETMTENEEMMRINMEEAQNSFEEYEKKNKELEKEIASLKKKLEG